MNVETILQTILVSTLMSMLPKFTEKLLALIQQFMEAYFKQAATETTKVHIDYAYERYVHNGDYVYSKGSKDVYEVIDKISIYLAHVSKTPRNANRECKHWHGYRFDAFMPKGEYDVDNVSITFSHESIKSENSMGQSARVVLASTTRTDIEEFLDKTKLHCDMLRRNLAPQYIMQESKDSRSYWTSCPLHTTTTWEDLIYPAKETLRDAIEQFDGSKLTFLLHGPPGTGKTSTIRAIATATKRSIVNIDLSLVPNNQSLHQIFFNTTRLHCRSGNSISFPPDGKFLYVFEEIDVQLDSIGIRSRLLERKDTDKEVETLDTFTKLIHRDRENRLDLGGLLTLLDGIQELRDTIIVMTTNHRDRLDDRLIRAGRVTHDIELGPLNKSNAQKLITKNFKKSPNDIRDNFWVPASLQRVIKQHEDDYARFLSEFHRLQTQ